MKTSATLYLCCQVQCTWGGGGWEATIGFNFLAFTTMWYCESSVMACQESMLWALLCSHLLSLLYFFFSLQFCSEKSLSLVQHYNQNWPIQITIDKRSPFKSACQDLGHVWSMEELEVGGIWLSWLALHWHTYDENSSRSHMSAQMEEDRWTPRWKAE